MNYLKACPQHKVTYHIIVQKHNSSTHPNYRYKDKQFVTRRCMVCIHMARLKLASYKDIVGNFKIS